MMWLFFIVIFSIMLLNLFGFTKEPYGSYFKKKETNEI